MSVVSEAKVFVFVFVFCGSEEAMMLSVWQKSSDFEMYEPLAQR